MRANETTWLASAALGLAQAGRLADADNWLALARTRLDAYGDRFAQSTVLLAEAALAAQRGIDAAATLARARRVAPSKAPTPRRRGSTGPAYRNAPMDAPRPNAIAEVRAALREPDAANRWFDGDHPQRSGWFLGTLTTALLRRTTTFEEIEQEAMAIAFASDSYPGRAPS